MPGVITLEETPAEFSIQMEYRNGKEPALLDLRVNVLEVNIEAQQSGYEPVDHGGAIRYTPEEIAAISKSMRKCGRSDRDLGVLSDAQLVAAFMTLNGRFNSLGEDSGPRPTLPRPTESSSSLPAKGPRT